MDLLIENRIVVEVKTVEAFTDVHLAQGLTYLKLGNYKLGLLIDSRKCSEERPKANNLVKILCVTLVSLCNSA
ncbi:MAG: GxxExxY protein [Cyclobacteriaceae bacterium]